MIHVHSVIVMAPLASIANLRDVGSPVRRAENGKVISDRFARNAPHDMNAEFQAQAVNAVDQPFDSMGK